MAKTIGRPAFQVQGSDTGRHREWTLRLAPTAEARDRVKDRPFSPDLAIIRVSAATEDAPFTALRMDLLGNGKKKRLHRIYCNDHAHPATSILTAPEWVRQLFADVTGLGELINIYAGPALGATGYFEHTTPDGRFAVTELQEAA